MSLTTGTTEDGALHKWYRRNMTGLDRLLDKGYSSMRLRPTLGVAILLSLAVSAAVFASRIGPPPIAKDLDCSDWRQCPAANSAFTGVLLARFPIGTPEHVLTDELRAQGFKHPPQMPETCLRPGEQAAIGTTAVTCPLWDLAWNPANSLSFEWGGPVCGREALVRWSSGRDGKITHLDGIVSASCL